MKATKFSAIFQAWSKTFVKGGILEVVSRTNPTFSATDQLVITPDVKLKVEFVVPENE